MDAILAHLFELSTGLPPVLELLAVFAIGVVPHLESYVCAFAWQALAVVGWGVVFAGLGLGAPADLT